MRSCPGWPTPRSLVCQPTSLRGPASTLPLCWTRASSADPQRPRCLVCELAADSNACRGVGHWCVRTRASSMQTLPHTAVVAPQGSVKDCLARSEQLGASLLIPPVDRMGLFSRNKALKKKPPKVRDQAVGAIS